MPQRKTPQIAPRKRPSQARSERTVELLLEAAARVLEQRGLEGYTTNAVAECCGVSVGSLYQYFPNKDALTSALVLKTHRDMEQYLAALRTQLAGLALQPAIEEMVRGAVVDARATPRLTKALEFEEARLPRCAELDAAEAGIHRHIASLLRTYVADSVTESQLSEAAHRTIGIVQGMAEQVVQHPTEGEPPECAVARAVIGYLAPLLRSDWQQLHLQNLH